MPNLKTVFYKGADKIGSFIAQEENYDPMLVLLIIILTLLEESILSHGSLYLFCCLLTFTVKWNILFALPFWIEANNWPIALAALVTSVASCTLKWKMYIFIFVSVVELYKHHEVSGFVVAAASLFITIQTAKNLIFQTIH